MNFSDNTSRFWRSCPAQENKTTVYLCENFSCQLPTSDLAELATRLDLHGKNVAIKYNCPVEEQNSGQWLALDCPGSATCRKVFCFS